MGGNMSEVLSAAVPHLPETPVKVDVSTGVARQWWMIVCLMLLSTLALVDKTIINLLVLPLQKALNLNKTEIGLIIGTAFAIGNIGLGIPAGWMADRWHRK